MIKHAIYVALASVLAAAALAVAPVQANDQIIRPYQSARSAAMGGVKITTGLYDENFFNNPARATANPTWSVELVNVLVETSLSTVDNIGDLTSGGDAYKNLANTAGNSNHARIQTVFPSVYVPHLGKMSYALGFVSNTQADVNLLKSYDIDQRVLTDIGPVFTAARRFLDHDRLSVGMNAHLLYRAQAKEGYGLLDYVRGTSFALGKTGQEGTNFDLDLGTTYVLPWKLERVWTLTAGASINNVLGGNYNLNGPRLLNTGIEPLQQPRTLGLGISAGRKSWGRMGETVFAFELSDIGNNANGSPFRLIHFGGETRWKFLLPRVGFYQGYLSAGLGIDLKHFEINLATYGEELSLNTGGKEDRRVTMQFSFHI